MVRGKLAVMTVAVLFFCLAVARGQEAMPAHEHAESGEHSAHDPQEPFRESEFDVNSDAPSQNRLVWTFHALGWKYAILLPASAMASFVIPITIFIFSSLVGLNLRSD